MNHINTKILFIYLLRTHVNNGTFDYTFSSLLIHVYNSVEQMSSYNVHMYVTKICYVSWTNNISGCCALSLTRSVTLYGQQNFYSFLRINKKNTGNIVDDIHSFIFDKFSRQPVAKFKRKDWCPGITTETRPTVLNCQAPYKVVGIRYRV